VNTVRLSAALAALTLTASTTCAAVIDLSNGLGPSGGYTSQAYYQVMLGGQPMTAAQQAYSNQQDQLRLLGFLTEFGGDIPLGQIFYHIAYGITPPLPPSTLDLANGGSDLPPPFVTPGGLVAGASDAGATGSVGADVDDGAVLTDVASVGAGLTLTGTTIAVPEPSTWAMLLLGFAGLGLMGWRASRKAAA
jgi:PEP-CTERM motif